MKKLNEIERKKIIKISFVIGYIEILTFIIVKYMQKLEKWLDVDFGFNNTYFKLNAPLILLSNVKILVIFIFITCVIYFAFRNYRKSISNAKQEIDGIKYKEKDGTHGTAGFENPHEMNDILIIGNEPNENGIILGKTIDTDELIVLPDTYKSLNRNIFIIGASGAGKSTKFIISNILKISQQDERTYAIDSAIKYGKNIVVTDPKGELYSETCVALEKEGYNVKLLNLVNPIYSDGIDLIKFMEDEQDAQTFAQIVMTTTNDIGTKKGDEFWQITQENLLKALLLHVLLEIEDENKKNMEYLYSIISSGDIKKIDRVFQNSKDVTKIAYNIYAQAGQSTKESVVTGLATKLQIFQLPRINAITSRNDIDFNKLNDEKLAIFCVISDTDSTMNFLNSLIFSFLFIKVIRLADRSPNRRLTRELSIILDEFTNIRRNKRF